METSKRVLGTMISEMRNPEVGYILSAGIDFLMIDTELSSSGGDVIHELVGETNKAGKVVY